MDYQVQIWTPQTCNHATDMFIQHIEDAETISAAQIMTAVTAQQHIWAQSVGEAIDHRIMERSFQVLEYAMQQADGSIRDAAMGTLALANQHSDETIQSWINYFVEQLDEVQVQAFQEQENRIATWMKEGEAAFQRNFQTLAQGCVEQFNIMQRQLETQTATNAAMLDTRLNAAGRRLQIEAGILATEAASQAEIRAMTVADATSATISKAHTATTSHITKRIDSVITTVNRVVLEVADLQTQLTAGFGRTRDQNLVIDTDIAMAKNAVADVRRIVEQLRENPMSPPVKRAIGQLTEELATFTRTVATLEERADKTVSELQAKIDNVQTTTREATNTIQASLKASIRTVSTLEQKTDKKTGELQTKLDAVQTTTREATNAIQASLKASIQTAAKQHTETVTRSVSNTADITRLTTAIAKIETDFKTLNQSATRAASVNGISAEEMHTAIATAIESLRTQREVSRQRETQSSETHTDIWNTLDQRLNDSINSTQETISYLRIILQQLYFKEVNPALDDATALRSMARTHANSLQQPVYQHNSPSPNPATPTERKVHYVPSNSGSTVRAEEKETKPKSFWDELKEPSTRQYRNTQSDIEDTESTFNVHTEPTRTHTKLRGDPRNMTIVELLQTMTGETDEATDAEDEQSVSDSLSQRLKHERQIEHAKRFKCNLSFLKVERTEFVISWRTRLTPLATSKSRQEQVETFLIELQNSYDAASQQNPIKTTYHLIKNHFAILKKLMKFELQNKELQHHTFTALTEEADKAFANGRKRPFKYDDVLHKATVAAKPKDNSREQHTYTSTNTYFRGRGRGTNRGRGREQPDHDHRGSAPPPYAGPTTGFNTASGTHPVPAQWYRK